MMACVQAALDQSAICCSTWSIPPAASRTKTPQALRHGDDSRDTPILLVLNKIDQLKDKARYCRSIEEYQRSPARFRGLHPDLRLERARARHAASRDRAPPAAKARRYFPPDYITDQPERFLAAELMREKILLETREEVPHSVAVMVDAGRRAAR